MRTQNRPLILASASPRRVELLSSLGISFQVAPTHVTELPASALQWLTPREFAWHNALKKAVAAQRQNPGAWILAADTIVAANQKIYGKPIDIQEAKQFLHELSGRSHFVLTGVVLISPHDRRHGFVEQTEVAFKKMREAEVDRYLAAVPVLDKAGAYAAQEKSEWIIAKIIGSRTNVIGLPMEKLRVLLRECGWKN